MQDRWRSGRPQPPIPSRRVASNSLETSPVASIAAVPMRRRIRACSKRPCSATRGHRLPRSSPREMTRSDPCQYPAAERPHTLPSILATAMRVRVNSAATPSIRPPSSARTPLISPRSSSRTPLMSPRSSSRTPLMSPRTSSRQALDAALKFPAQVFNVALELPAQALEFVSELAREAAQRHAHTDDCHHYGDESDHHVQPHPLTTPVGGSMRHAAHRPQPRSTRTSVCRSRCDQTSSASSRTTGNGIAVRPGEAQRGGGGAGGGCACRSSPPRGSRAQDGRYRWARGR